MCAFSNTHNCCLQSEDQDRVIVDTIWCGHKSMVTFARSDSSLIGHKRVVSDLMRHPLVHLHEFGRFGRVQQRPDGPHTCRLQRASLLLVEQGPIHVHPRHRPPTTIIHCTSRVSCERLCTALQGCAVLENSFDDLLLCCSARKSAFMSSPNRSLTIIVRRLSSKSI